MQTPGRSPSPVDHDLQRLYNEVWANFSDESAAADRNGDRDIDNIYRDYGADPGTTSPPPQVPGANGRRNYAPSTPSSHSASAPKARRALPPTPASASFPPTLNVSMPEPARIDYENHYHHPSRVSYANESHATADSNDLLRKAVTAPSSGRRLPPAPAPGGNGGSKTSPTSPWLPGLPTDPRPTSRTSSLGYAQSSTSSNPPSGSGANVSRTPSDRPPGAKFSVSPSAYSSTHGEDSRYTNDYFGGGQETRHPTDNGYQARPYHLPTSANSLTTHHDLRHKPSRENMSGTQDLYEAYSPQTASDTQPYTGRNPSVSSSGTFSNPRNTSYDQHNLESARLGRNTSAMSVPSREFDYPNPGYGSSQNLAMHDPPPIPDLQEEGEYWEDEEEDPHRFINYALLSHIAVQLRDKIPRGTHVKSSIPYEGAFTGKDVVSTIQSLIQRDLAINLGLSTSDRRTALQVARSLQSQLFFYDVEWGSGLLQDGVEDVYMFLDDAAGTSGGGHEREELPTGVITMLTGCYAASCIEGDPCYSYACPRRGNAVVITQPAVEAPVETKKGNWSEIVGEHVTAALPKSEIDRQNAIHSLVSREEQYIQDIDFIESAFLKPLRSNITSIVPLDKVDTLIDDIFGNILDLRECNRRLLEALYVRLREQTPIVVRIGDVFLNAANEFKLAYPIYISRHQASEKKLKEEIEQNTAFKLFLEKCSRTSTRQSDVSRPDLKILLSRPTEHISKCIRSLETIMKDTDSDNTDAETLVEAVAALKNLTFAAQVRAFQDSMGIGPLGKQEWHDLLPSADFMAGLSKKEAKRQSVLFELISSEMLYVKDLENIETMYIQPLRSANPPVIDPDKLDQFIHEVFHNFGELHYHHKKLLDQLHKIQRDEHPLIHSVTAPIFDTALNFRDAYMKYIPNYPIAEYRIKDEMANNPAFNTFVAEAVRHESAHRLDMKSFINRPIPRLLRYELLLKGVMEDSEEDHEDRVNIPNVIDVIKTLGKESEPGVTEAKAKVELWNYNSNLVFKPGDFVDLGLLEPERSLKFSGKLLRQPESGLEWSGLGELFVLLFDHYLVMTKPKEKDGVTKYHVNRRPIPLELLTLVNFTDPPTQRGTGILRTLRVGERYEGAAPTQSPESVVDPRSVYPFTIHYNGRLGGSIVLYAESGQWREQWKNELQQQLNLRQIVQDSNKVFEPETLSTNTFLVSANPNAGAAPAWNQGTSSLTGKVTCSVPFNMRDGRNLVAIGCADGVFIGFRHDPTSIRRVLHLKMVTQCAILEDFGIFLVLADKSLFAYHIEALVPSTPQGAQMTQTPQKLNGSKDVQFFYVGFIQGRTLVVYMKRNGLDSVFRVLEPVTEKINERGRTPMGLTSRLGLRSAKSEWFRVYRVFFLPSETFDLIFLKTRLAILCAKGFELMELPTLGSVTIPYYEDPRLLQLAKRCEAGRPMGMFKTNDDGFLLIYDEFGFYVDRHGDLVRSGMTIEWENTVERVACHAPYILLFNSRYIEIRHIETGRLVQIIQGNEIRCIYDGRGGGGSLNPNVRTAGSDFIDREAQVHVVMNAAEPAGPGGYKPNTNKVIAQHVFQLVPTQPFMAAAEQFAAAGGGGLGPASPGIASPLGTGSGGSFFPHPQMPTTMHQNMGSSQGPGSRVSTAGSGYSTSTSTGYFPEGSGFGMGAGGAMGGGQQSQQQQQQQQQPYQHLQHHHSYGPGQGQGGGGGGSTQGGYLMGQSSTPVRNSTWRT